MGMQRNGPLDVLPLWGLFLAILLLVLLALPLAQRPARAMDGWTTYIRMVTCNAVLAQADTVWLATGEAGILRYLRSASRFESVTREPSGLASNAVTALVFDRSGRLWAGTSGKGASRLAASGATWDLLGPWCAQGRLPHLEAIRRRGLWGPLASTMPPATLPSWSTFMTGVNPGKHGIYDFTRRRTGTYEIEFVNATFRKVPTVWRRLSEAGRRVCVLGLPGTYPPEILNGYMVSGFDTPVTTRADASFIAPSSLAPLVMQMGGFPFADFQEFRVGPDWHRTAIDRLLRGIETKARLGQTLLQREPRPPDSLDCYRSI
jgi:hypothetical protein